MNDFISMMGYRETALQKIIDRLDEDESIDIICRESGIPLSDLLSDEKARIMKELNERQ